MNLEIYKVTEETFSDKYRWSWPWWLRECVSIEEEYRKEIKGNSPLLIEIMKGNGHIKLGDYIIKDGLDNEFSIRIFSQEDHKFEYGLKMKIEPRSNGDQTGLTSKNVIL